MNDLNHPDKFLNRHIGPKESNIELMLKDLGLKSLDELIEQTIPSNIRLKKLPEFEEPISEYQLLNKLQEIGQMNKVFKSYIGLGYYPTITPPVIQRNILENPGWYTQYTPYQAEISQGRLEALINFQTAVIDLTGLPIANASLLDEGTAAAEAMTMFFAKRKNKDANKFFASKECFPQTIDILKTRSTPLGIELVIGDHKNIELNQEIFGLIVQYPASEGEVYDYSELFSKADKSYIYKAVAADFMSLSLLKPPGEFGADAAVGSTQRFGIPMGFGGPHAAYFACKDEFKRNLPGRVIGESIDASGNKGYRLALQTREQHIRREKATSNICTAQVLLAVIAGMYAVYHGPKGIKSIAERISKFTSILANSLSEIGINQLNQNYFDTLLIDLENETLFNKIKSNAEKTHLNFRYLKNNKINISISEVTSLDDMKEIITLFSKALGKDFDFTTLNLNTEVNIQESFKRKSKYLFSKIFNSYHSETEMMRYMKRLENKDLSLVHSMTPLGSCTMKLNAASELLSITNPNFNSLHPFAPSNQTEGFAQIFKELKNDLSKLTGFAETSLQPNSGAQGEYAGLMVIKAYHESRGEGRRNIVLIPSSAHGTNPASAVMAGNNVIVIKCDNNGNIDVTDLKTKLETNKNNISSLMVTYPSTHGVFESSIKEVCELVHKNGGQVYMDGANLNAQVGLTSPGEIGADVCHINLHKTFSIPHGGGGPGMGPIAVADHLIKFLPGHSVVNIGSEHSISAISAAPWGSASILLISYAYIKMMGIEGLKRASQVAILNANYIKERLKDSYNVVYQGENERVAHELIFDMHPFKDSVDISESDIAKRLMDYGFHAPTVSFPVHGTLMVEPTESESKMELDRFCEAMISIRKEIKDIEEGKSDKNDNVLKNAPHTIFDIVSGKWEHPYTREEAVFPIEWVRSNKFWPPIKRIDNAYGDRNLICSCNPIEVYK
ncbi:MAG: glycine dehydrogenase (aminomethyl-transferring) [Ignavibacteriales bacterium CG_4_9_14_3_um_filter_30_11]|nr:MAG: glycine dehydrogenase (aminomethyl-transferring) [Ignavibacteriales bacterium CG_4_9_14_3_um_filter_30_11]